MELTTRFEGLLAIITPAGELDAHTTTRLERALNDLLAQNHVQIILDFTRVNYISSAGLRVLLAAQNQAVARGGKLRLFGLTAPVRQVFELTQFNKILPLAATLQDACADW